MYTIITPDKIELPPGTVVKLLGDWEDYQTLSQKLGDRKFPRLKYRHGEILLMTPLAESTLKSRRDFTGEDDEDE